MPTLRDHLRDAEDAGRGGGRHGGHHGGHRHHGGRGGRGGGVVFYDRSPDVVVVTDDCPPGFYYDEFGDCRPLPYHSMRRAVRPRVVGQNAGHFDERMRPIPCPPAAGDAGAVADLHTQAPRYDMRRPTFDAALAPRFYDRPDTAGDAGQVNTLVGWFNPFDPIGSGYAYQTLRDRDALAAEIMTTDARIASAQQAHTQIPAEVIFDYVAFHKDWDAVKGDDITTVELASMKARFRAQLDVLAKYMKVDDLRPAAPLAQTVPKVIDNFSTSVKTVGIAGAVTVVAVVAIAAYLLRPHLGSIVETQRTNALTAAKLAK